MAAGVDHLTTDESNALLKAIDSVRDRAIVTLFLNTGLFLNECVELKVGSVDWEKRVLRVPGQRARELVLNDQAYEALARWSQERPAGRSDALFVTERGRIKKLVARGIDKHLRKYARMAGIRRKVNTQLLRNTFAVRLFSRATSIDEASAILGIVDPVSINRYIKAARSPLPRVPEHVDTRPRLAKALGKVFPAKPRPAVVIAERPAPSAEATFGRDGVIAELKGEIGRGGSVLLTAPAGTGKSHLLKELKRQYPAAIMAETPVPVRPLLKEILTRLDRRKAEEVTARMPVKEILALINSALAGERPLLLIDNLNRLKAPDADVIAALMENFTVAAAADELPARLQTLGYKFKPVRLARLDGASARELARHWTADLDVGNRELLETRILSLANGLPLSIVELARQARRQPRVTDDSVHELYHEAGVYYRDWTPLLLILWGVAIGSRFVALGTHSFEGYIIAGFGTAALMTTIRFLRMVR
ncbi:MAG: tyrosine-type recombinase/integrase [Candidatus Saganbacteria bacterium]|nr:tyrosine-type recombinase/integrase [Candidatus Saganbacteria bacterium]